MVAAEFSVSESHFQRLLSPSEHGGLDFLQASLTDSDTTVNSPSLC